jgi:hypothetical protein
MDRPDEQVALLYTNAVDRRESSQVFQCVRKLSCPTLFRVLPAVPEPSPLCLGVGLLGVWRWDGQKLLRSSGFFRWMDGRGSRTQRIKLRLVAQFVRIFQLIMLVYGPDSHFS